MMMVKLTLNNITGLFLKLWKDDGKTDKLKFEVDLLGGIIFMFSKNINMVYSLIANMLILY